MVTTRNDAMLARARRIVADYWNENEAHKFKNNKGPIPMISTDDVYIVWFCKTLQNWKALASTDYDDNLYFEITHNGDKNETYVDTYRKEVNFTVK